MSDDDRIGIKLAPFTPSGDGVLKHAIDLLSLTKDDILLDLGCGDARMLVFTAETIGARCIGVEYDKGLVQKAERRIKEHQVQNLVQIIHADALTFDLESSSATAIFMYLVPQGIKLMLPKLEEARSRGIRIVTYVFSIPGWECVDKRDYKGTKVYLYNSK